MRGQPLWLLTLAACQDYAFEARETRLSKARRSTEIVTTVRPADILFVIDNSASMIDELSLLETNIGLFINQLSASANNYQLAFITPDIECNVPGRSCIGGGTSSACCAAMQCGNDGDCSPGQTCSGGQCVCQDLVVSGRAVASSCDGGRLRASPNDGTRVFARPTDADRNAWEQNVRATIGSFGCKGSGYEGTLEAVRRAVLCAAGATIGTGPNECPSKAIADINAGLIRPEADLIIIFVTDEDDCSVMFGQADGDLVTDGSNLALPQTFVPEAYLRPTDSSLANEQRDKFCTPNECYGYLGPDTDMDGIVNWADGTTVPAGYSCNTSGRLAPIPNLAGLTALLDGAIAAKGDVTRVRAGAILGSVPDPNNPLGALPSPCYKNGAAGSPSCGCWANSGANLYCDVTDVSGGLSGPPAAPTGHRIQLCSRPCSVNADCGGSQCVDSRCETSGAGCNAMTGGRIYGWLEQLADRRVSANAEMSVLVDSICRVDYADTLERMARIITLDNCFDIGHVITNPDTIRVVYQGAVLSAVPVGATRDGYSYVVGSSEICLQGNLKKNIGDRFEIFVLDDN